MSDAPHPPTAGCRIREPGPTDGIGPPTCDELYAQLRTVDDPVLGDDIVSLGLVDDVSVDRELIVVEMGLYAPYAPTERRIVEDVHDAMRFFDRKVVTVASGHERGGSSARRLASVRNVVPVTDVGDAVDGSTMATNIAFALSRIGARVGTVTLDEGVDAGAAGTSGVPATVHGVTVARAGTVEHAVTEIDWGGLDYLLVDVPTDPDELFEAAFDRFPTPGPVMAVDRSTSVADARSRLARLDERGITPLGVVETTGGSGREEHHDRVERTPGSWIAEHAERSLFGRVPDTLADDAEQGTPVVWAGHELSAVFDSIGASVADAVGAVGRRAHAERARGGDVGSS